MVILALVKHVSLGILKLLSVLLYKKASIRLITFNGLKVAVLCLTFKSGTDGLKEIASFENVPIRTRCGFLSSDSVGAENFTKVHSESKNGKDDITCVSNIEHT